MEQYGFAVTYYPPGVTTDRSNIVFEVKVYEEGKGTKFVEVLDMDWDMPLPIEARATTPEWMKRILQEAVAMTDHAAQLDETVTDNPAVVKAYIGSGILPDQD